MGEDIFEIKPSIGLFSLDMRALWRHLSDKRKIDPVAEVAARFLQLFQDHGIAIPQIPRLIPDVKLENLRSTESLLPALTTGVIDKAVDLFGVRRKWLDGVDVRIYERLYCYKQPELFFERLTSIIRPENGFAVRVLSSAKVLNGKDCSRQCLALVLVERIQDLGDEEITRYHVYGDEWDWSHSPCRLQLKAMARLIFQIYHRPIPIHRVNDNLLQVILEGKSIPHTALQGCLLTRPSLENFALSCKESAQAKETGELPEVLGYIQTYDLENVVKLIKKNHNT